MTTSPGPAWCHLSACLPRASWASSLRWRSACWRPIAPSLSLPGAGTLLGRGVLARRRSSSFSCRRAGAWRGRRGSAARRWCAAPPPLGHPTRRRQCLRLPIHLRWRLGHLGQRCARSLRRTRTPPWTGRRRRRPAWPSPAPPPPGSGLPAPPRRPPIPRRCRRPLLLVAPPPRAWEPAAPRQTPHPPRSSPPRRSCPPCRGRRRRCWRWTSPPTPAVCSSPPTAARWCSRPSPRAPRASSASP
mmetsp:Transcript_6967/g.14071  ORF Transcript_6967/g.14071 Transcript_6967/m.14071 type:complete len:244 (-) Transcript_6967:1722-2453(-)